MSKKKKLNAETTRRLLEDLKFETGRGNADLVKLLRPQGSPKKGSTYERQLCKEFSLWWSENKRDDLFWRSAGSGGRATTRSKQGKTTVGHYGDMAATDKTAQPFLDIFTVEIKRGYSTTTPHDILDSAKTGAAEQFAQFIAQAEQSSYDAETKSWLLIHKRNQRKATIWMPWHAAKNLKLSHRGGQATLDHNGIEGSIVGMGLDTFFKFADPRQGLYKRKD